MKPQHSTNVDFKYEVYHRQRLISRVNEKTLFSTYLNNERNLELMIY